MKNIKLCVFDAYGTLFDVHSASFALKDEIGENYKGFSDLWRAKQLEYSFLREIMGEYKNFISVTEDALVYAMKTFDIKEELKPRLMELYKKLDAYDEVKGVLKKLQENGIKTAILSNGCYEMLNMAVESSGIGEFLDAVISVEEIKRFKPCMKVYDMANKKFGVNSEEVVFFSSNGWDIAGAKSFGFNTIWINRFSKQIDILNSEPDFMAMSLKNALELLKIK